MYFSDQKKSSQNGFTLVEMLMVLAISCVLLSLAGPSFRDLIKSIQLKGATDSLFMSIQLARSEAIKRNERVVICKSANGNSCTTTGGWQQGWIVFVDAISNNKVDRSEEVLFYQQAFDADITITGNAPLSNYISYKGSGTTVQFGGAFQAGTITACNLSNARVEAHKIIVSNVGKARHIREKIAKC